MISSRWLKNSFGLEDNLDISIYANKKYSGEQMEQIRLGLENKIDVSKYANVEYDDIQMLKIRKELKQNI